MFTFPLTFHFSPGKNPSLFLPQSLHFLFDLTGFCSDLQQNINWELHNLQRLFDVWIFCNYDFRAHGGELQRFSGSGCSRSSGQALLSSINREQRCAPGHRF